MELASNSKIQVDELIQEICQLMIHRKSLSEAFTLIMENICNNSKVAFEFCKNTDVNSFPEESNIVLNMTNFNNSQLENFRKFDQNVHSTLDRVSTDNLRLDLTYLSDFNTKHSESPLLNEAGNWKMNQFEIIGYKDTFYHSFAATIDNAEFLLSQT